MITEDDVSKAFDFLRDSAKDIADARHNKVRAEEMRKVVWSQLRRECNEKTQSEKDAYAYSHDLYIMHIGEMAEAARKFEHLRALREAALSKIEAWRTASANERGAYRAVA